MNGILNIIWCIFVYNEKILNEINSAVCNIYGNFQKCCVEMSAA